MLTLLVEAPFAACRTFTAGWYRPTATFLTPSAAYGLLLNIAGIETRLREEDGDHPGGVPATLTRAGLPAARIALGAPAERGGDPVAFEYAFPRVGSVYQQLHNYPVGNSGTERSKTAFGNKYNITPVRRELLIDLRAAVVLDGNPELEEAVRRGLSGASDGGRYGLPFVGDNSFLPDRIEEIAGIPPAYWFERVGGGDSELRPRTTRLTVWIDRADLSRTRSELYAPAPAASPAVPDAAWTDLTPP